MNIIIILLAIAIFVIGFFIGIFITVARLVERDMIKESDDD